MPWKLCWKPHHFSLPTPHPHLTLQVGLSPKEDKLSARWTAAFTASARSLASICLWVLYCAIFHSRSRYFSCRLHSQCSTPKRRNGIFISYSSTMIYLHRRIRILASNSPSLGLHKWMCSLSTRLIRQRVLTAAQWTARRALSYWNPAEFHFGDAQD